MIDILLAVISYFAMLASIVWAIVIVTFAGLIAGILALLVFSVFRTPRQELPYPHVGEDE